MLFELIVDKMARRELKERDSRFSSHSILLDEEADLLTLADPRSILQLGDTPPERRDSTVKNRPCPSNMGFEQDELDELTFKLNLQEEAIYLEKERWEATFNAIPDIVLIVDRDKRIIQVNDCFETSTGVLKRDIIGKFCYEVLIPETDMPKCRNSSLLSCGSCLPDSKEINGKYLKGKYIFSYNPIIDKNDTHVANVIVLRDITKLTKAEKDLASRESLLNSINFAGGILIQDSSWDDAVNMALENIQKNLNVDVAFIARKEEKSDEYVIINSYSSLPFNMVEANEKLRHHDVIEYMKTYKNTHEIHKPLIYRSDFLQKRDKTILNMMGMSSILSVPIMFNQKIWGVLAVSNFGKEVDDTVVWDQMKIRVIQTLSNLLSSFITKIRMRDAIGHIPDEEKWTHFITALLNDQIEYSIRFNAEMKLTFVSKAFCDLVGKTKDQLLGTALCDIFTENAKYFDEIKSMLNEFTKENSHVKRFVKLEINGETTTHRHIIRAIFNGSDTPIDYQCVGIDLDSLSLRGECHVIE